MELVLKQEVYDIIGACFEVYNEKGSGFLEAVYQACLEIELELRRIPFQAQVELPLTYKGQETEADVSCRYSMLRSSDRRVEGCFRTRG